MTTIPSVNPHTDAQQQNDIDEILAVWSKKTNDAARLKAITDAQDTRLRKLYEVRDAIWADDATAVAAALSKAKTSEDKALAAAIENLILERRDYDSNNRMFVVALCRAALWSWPLIVMSGLFIFYGPPTLILQDPASFFNKGLWISGLVMAGGLSAYCMWAAFHISVPWGRSLQLAPCDQLQTDGGEA